MATNGKSEVEMLPMSVQRKTMWHLQQMKNKGQKISMVGPAYLDPLFTMFCEKAGVDMVRIVAPGETPQMRMANTPWWVRNVRKMAPNININVVMSTAQYCDGPTAVKYASELLEEPGADSVLCMGVTNQTLKYMTDNYIPVFGHVGCLSGWQTGQFGGYRRQGKTAEDAYKIYRMAYEYQELGMKGMTIEMTSRELTDVIAKKLDIPVIAVAAGGVADGSEMVIFDLLGFLPPEAMAKHSKAYMNMLGECIGAFHSFDDEVKTEKYPVPENGWSMDQAEFEKFETLVDNDKH